ncbi:MAG TPA: PIG-L family deacetylase [Candidatus Saccharimonadales bacterium]|nr:PIG-L family deacetylase [Candidatus Saccharimonadales bacterium]
MEELSPLNAFCLKLWHRLVALLGGLARPPRLPAVYAGIATVLLFASVVFWAVLGARLQIHNADQLSDPYLFTNWQTFQGATFPGAHSLLLKWPIFWWLGLAGVTSAHLLIATVSVSVLTVAALAFLLHKIERRPLVLGTLYLALALMLLLVPAQPYAGGILPVNMAMLTTRNLEYIVYLACLLLFIRGRRLRSPLFLFGVILLGILIASDRLFLGLSLGGAAVALVLYALFTNLAMVAFAVRWLIASIGAGIICLLITLLVTGLHFTHLTGGSVSPYGTGIGGKDLLLSVAYSLLGFLTNAGANPVYDNRVIAQLPHALAASLTHPSGALYLVAVVLVLLGLWLIWRLVRGSLHHFDSHTALPVATQLSLTLFCSTAAAFGLFVVSKHYYAVDARYLTIGFFALMIGATTVLRGHVVRQPKWLLLIGLGLMLSSLAASVTARTVASTQTAALNDVSYRNKLVTQALEHHHVDVLVGDYWRVLPIKLAAHGKLNVMPLYSCTTPLTALSSTTWQPDLRRHSFAYLITFDGSLTNYPSCTLQQVTAAYGVPNATQIIAGTLTHPKGALLFYDAGSHPRSAADILAHVTLAPVAPDQLLKTNCTQPTVMNFVAHEDDDLLFLSPDLLHTLQAGYCVRTVFLTAGDDGQDKFYWLGRQLGAEAAYSAMLHIKNVWDHQTVQVAPGEYLTVATPRDSNQVSLVFLNLPDGNLQGQGFPGSDYQSMAKLQAGVIERLRSVDNQSSYTRQQLVAALVLLMDIYEPAEIHTQADAVPTPYPDHSDHINTSRLTQEAADQYDFQHFGGAVTIPVKHYIGYPIHGYAPNVTGDELNQKIAAFFAYGQHDSGTCHSMLQCQATTYSFYLSREYQQGVPL